MDNFAATYLVSAGDVVAMPSDDAATRAGKVLGWSDDGSSLENMPVVPGDPSGLTVETTPMSGDLFYIWDTVAGELKSIDFDDMPGGASAGSADAVQTSDGAGGFQDSGASLTSTSLVLSTFGYVKLGSQFGYDWKVATGSNTVYLQAYLNRGVSLQTLTNFGFNLYGSGDLSFGISTGTSNGSAPDVCLARDDADQWAMRRGSSPNSLAVYSAYTDTSNYERLRTFTQTADSHVIASESAGTGVQRSLKIGHFVSDVFTGLTLLTDGKLNAPGDALTVARGSNSVQNVSLSMSGGLATVKSSTGSLYFSTGPSSGMYISGTTLNLLGAFKLGPSSTPASSNATGTTGQLRWDADYVYLCTATNTWKRTPLTTW